jgi:hypothetical protein
MPKTIPLLYVTRVMILFRLFEFGYSRLPFDWAQGGELVEPPFDWAQGGELVEPFRISIFDIRV